jgi:uncharacterized protein DUF6919
VTPKLPAWLVHGDLTGLVVVEEEGPHGDRPLTREERARYRADANAWFRASSLRSLGLLTADWIEGKNLYLPAYCATCPDPETRPLIPTLAAANRAGLVTNCSQPGRGPAPGYNGRLWRQLAAVSGFCDERTAASLNEAFAGHAAQDGLYVYIWGPDRKPRRKRGEYEIPATVHADAHDPADEWLSTVFGPPLSRREVRSIYRGDLSRAAVKTLQGAWQVTIADTEYGRNDRLWSLLDKWAPGGAS